MTALLVELILLVYSVSSLSLIHPMFLGKENIFICIQNIYICISPLYKCAPFFHLSSSRFAKFLLFLSAGGAAGSASLMGAPALLSLLPQGGLLPASKKNMM